MKNISKRYNFLLDPYLWKAAVELCHLLHGHIQYVHGWHYVWACTMS